MKNIKKLRTQANMSARELADLSEVSQRSIHAYEQGSRDINGASGIVLYQISKVLKCRIEDLLELGKEK